ncbi:hypothetical protein ACFX11_028458 [Malus domestica]
MGDVGVMDEKDLDLLYSFKRTAAATCLSSTDTKKCSAVTPSSLPSPQPSNIHLQPLLFFFFFSTELSSSKRGSSGCNRRTVSSMSNRGCYIRKPSRRRYRAERGSEYRDLPASRRGERRKQCTQS